MKITSHILPALRLTLAFILLFTVLYPAVIWFIGRIAAPNAGMGETISYSTPSGSAFGYTAIGQAFKGDEWFWSRPSAVNYNAAGSGGSNKGPTNPEYLAVVESRIDTFLTHNPGISKAEIPGDLVTASGSGLDPHISPQAALVQVKRVAAKRHLSEDKVRSLVEQHTEFPLLGLFGPSRINVLELNLALNQLK